MTPNSRPDSDHENAAPRALEGGMDALRSASPAPLRGEVFDFDLDNPDEGEGQTLAQKKAAMWFVAALASLFCVYNFGAFVGRKSAPSAPVGTFSSQIEKPVPLRVQIAGKVKKPGVYTLPAGARLEDALLKAGGALPNADLDALNLADWAVDGSKIVIPDRKTRKIAPTPTPVVIIKEVIVTPPQNAPDGASPEILARAAISKPEPAPSTAEKPRSATSKTRPAPKSGGKSAPDALALLRKSPVDLNRASLDQLSVLPGVGPKMAERIIAYRRENGGFKAVSDLDNVKGIGEKRMETLKDLVKVK